MFHCVFPWLTRNAWSEMTSFNRWLWVSLVIARLWRRRQVTEQDSAAGAAMTWRQRLVLVDWNQVLLIVLRKIGNWNFFPLWMYFILTGDRVSCSSLDHPGVYTFGGWRAGTESYPGSTELLIIIFMDELWLSSMNYCNSWKRVLNYGLIFLIGRQNVRFGHWQYKCSYHLMNVTSFWTFCQVLCSPYSQFHQPTCFWKWVGGTNPFKSGILSSEADPEKNIHCSWQDGHIIGTGNTWNFRKCLWKKIFVHNFCHKLGQTILLQFDHSPPPIWSLVFTRFVGFLRISFHISYHICSKWQCSEPHIMYYTLFGSGFSTHLPL